VLSRVRQRYLDVMRGDATLLDTELVPLIAADELAAPRAS
jgi:hypothetical protein